MGNPPDGNFRSIGAVPNYMRKNATKGPGADNASLPIFEALAHPTGLRVLRLLAAADRELCVCELVDCLDQPQYEISRHLKRLRSAGLLCQRKEGRWVYHSLADSGSPFVRHILQAVASLPPQAREEKELSKRLAIRVGGKCLLGIQKTNLLPGRKEGKGCHPQKP